MADDLESRFKEALAKLPQRMRLSMNWRFLETLRITLNRYS